MRLYAHLGQRFMAEGLPPSGAVYAKWFEEYSSPGMEELSKSLEALLDADKDDPLNLDGDDQAHPALQGTRSTEAAEPFARSSASRVADPKIRRRTIP